MGLGCCLVFVLFSENYSIEKCSDKVGYRNCLERGLEGFVGIKIVLSVTWRLWINGT